MCWCWFLCSSEKLISLLRGARRADEGLIRKRCPDGREKVGSEPRLNDIAEPARIECGAGVVGVFVGRKEDGAGRPLRAPELARRFDAVEPRHGDIEHDDIEMEPLRLGEKPRSSPTQPTTKHSRASASAVSARIAG